MIAVVTVGAIVVGSGTTNAESVFKCKTLDGEYSYQSTPCAAGSTEEQVKGGTFSESANRKDPTLLLKEMYKIRSPDSPDQSGTSKPKTPEESSPVIKSFVCGCVIVKRFTPYENLVSRFSRGRFWSGIVGVTRIQCVSGTFGLRAGRVPQWNDKTFAETFGSNLRAVLRNGEIRSGDRAVLPPRSQVDRFRALKTYEFDACFGESPHPVIELRCE